LSNGGSGFGPRFSRWGSGNIGSGLGNGGYGYGSGFSGWGSGYGGSGYGSGGYGNRNSGYVWVFIPSLGWVYVPIRLMIFLGL
jgi:hypothetical protein